MALADYQVQIGGGLILDSDDGYRVSSIEGLGRDSREQDYDRPSADGSVLGPDYSPAKTVTITLTIVADTDVAAMGKWDALAAAWNSARLTEGRSTDVPLRWKLPGRPTQRLQSGRPRKLAPIFDDLVVGCIRVVGTYYAADPRIVADEQRVLDIPYGSTLTLPNDGNHPAAVQWDVYGQAVNPALIRDEADRFDLTTAIGTSDFYRLRTDPRTVTRASDSGNLYQTFSGTWLEVPPGGAVFRAVRASGTGPRIRATYRDTWMG